MSKKKVARILRQIANLAAPADDVDLWPALQGRIQSSEYQKQRGIEMNARFTHRSNRLRNAIMLAMAAVFALGLFLVTPQGRALARQIWQFFRTNESDVLVSPLAGEAGKPGFSESPVPTFTPVSIETCGNWAKPLCSFQQVQQRLDFTLKQFSHLPNQVRFAGAYMDGDIVLLRYTSGLDLVQMPAERYARPAVGASARIETVLAGDLRGEYLQGSWFGGKDDPQITWQADTGTQTLVWEQNGVVYVIQAYDAQWTKDFLIALAVELAETQPNQNKKANPFGEDPTVSNDPGRIMDISEAEALVGYAIHTLNPIPAGYIFHYASLHRATKSVCLHYMFTGNDGPGPYLLVGQGPINAVPELIQAEVGLHEPVTIGGAQEGTAFQVIGMRRSQPWACTEASDMASTLSLTWQYKDYQFDLYALGGGCAMAEGFTTLDQLRLAEILTGVSTNSESELDPECLQQIEDAQQLVDFQVKSPSWLPETLTFGSASVSNRQGRMNVDLVYRVSVYPHPAIVIAQTPIDPEAGQDLDSYAQNLPEQGYERFAIEGQPALIVRGAWLQEKDGSLIWYDQNVAETLYWESDGILITVMGPWLAVDGGDSKELLIKIAKSMK